MLKSLSFRLPLVSAIAIAALPYSAQAEPNAVLYQLQERCGRSASAFFKEEWPHTISNTKDGQTISSYENHYDPDLNKCFLLETDRFSGKKNGKRTGWVSQSLFDINDNKSYGSFMLDRVYKNGDTIDLSASVVTIVCEVKDHYCYSEGEWKSFIKPYIGN